ncbi:MAG: NYN domain-containing protein [Calditrichaeota bacterium]|nr:NYN domain-containing protein [Calditrichota bacterium]
MNRIVILIDGNNFYKGCQLNFNRTDVDFKKLGSKLCESLNGTLLRVYYYNAHVSKSLDPLGYQRQQKFFDNLRSTPYITLRLGHLVYHRLRSEQGFSQQFFPTEKGIDVQIAVDMIRLGLLKACEGIVLVSGDSDYVHAVRFAKDLGCNVYIASFPLGGSNELRNEGDGHIVIDYNFIQDCLIRANGAAKLEIPSRRDTIAVESEPPLAPPNVIPSIQEDIAANDATIVDNQDEIISLD